MAVEDSTGSVGYWLIMVITFHQNREDRCYMTGSSGQLLHPWPTPLK
jgi:hypothetical protein